jgi:hypothetical protein
MSTLFETDVIPLFIVNLVATLVLLRGVYFSYSSNRETLFGLLMFAVGVFLVTYFLHNVDMSMGFAFGLFAVFSMLRYRTESLNIRDMTYLFLVIVMSLMTAVSQLAVVQLIIIHGIVCVIAALAETRLLAARVYEKSVKYENIQNVRPENHQALIDDLTLRTGLVIREVNIGDIDFLKDVAELKIYYVKPHQVFNPTVLETKASKKNLIQNQIECGSEL